MQDLCQTHHQVCLIILPKDSTKTCKNCKSDLEYMAVNDGTLVFNCVNCKKNDDEEFEEHLAKRLENTYRLCDGDTKNIAWRCLSNETSFQDKKEFYRNLTIDFRIQNSVESHDL